MHDPIFGVFDDVNVFYVRLEGFIEYFRFFESIHGTNNHALKTEDNAFQVKLLCSDRNGQYLPFNTVDSDHLHCYWLLVKLFRIDRNGRHRPFHIVDSDHFN